MYANGASRTLAHDLTDIIQSDIVNDIRTLYEPQWTRRGMWDRAYFEARVPAFPPCCSSCFLTKTSQI